MELENLKKLAKAANEDSPSPWRRQDFYSSGDKAGVAHDAGGVVCMSYVSTRPAVFDFIAAASPATVLDLISLLEQVEVERAALAEWKRQAEWIDEPFKAEALAEYGFAAPTPREFAIKILERHRPHVAKLQAERDVLAAKLKELEEQEPAGWWFTDDPRVFAMPGAGYHAGKAPPQDAINCTPLFARPIPAEAVRLTDEEIEALRQETFSTDNPFCPCDRKTMHKAARAAEQAILRKQGYKVE